VRVPFNSPRLVILCVLALLCVSASGASAHAKIPARSGTAEDTLRVSAGGIYSVTGVWHRGAPESPKVFIWFHGGMQSANCQKGLVAGNALDTLASSDASAVVVSASACGEHHWLSQEMLRIPDAALDSLERRWNVKISSVALVGVSDGGLGVLGYSLYGRRTVISRMLISTNLTQTADAASLSALPRVQTGRWLFIQGGNDRLYPAPTVLPWQDAFCKGVGLKRCEIKTDSRGEHDWSWWRANRKEWLDGYVRGAFLPRKP
jgi:hypothetical protein